MSKGAIDLDKTFVDLWDVKKAYIDIKTSVEKHYIPRIKTISLRKALAYFKTEQYKEITNQIRNLIIKKSLTENKEEKAIIQSQIDEIKGKKLQSITFGSTYKKKRNKNDLISCSGLITLDYDEVKDVKKNKELYKLITSIPHVFMCCYSPSGGLKFLVRIPVVSNDDEYKSYLYGFVVYLRDKYNITLDTSGQDVTRLCYISYDDNMFINVNATTFTDTATKDEAIIKIKESKQTKSFKNEKKKTTILEQDNSEIPSYCGLIEKVHNKKFSESGEGYVKHTLLDPFVYNYCKIHKKTKLLNDYMSLHGREQGSFNDAEKLGFNCGSLINYTKNRLGIEYITENCKKCPEYQKYKAMLSDEEDEIEIVRDKEMFDPSNILKNPPRSEHLFLFDNLKSELGYKGKDVDYYAKMLWYRTNAIMQTEQQIILGKKLKSDNRFHGLIIGYTNSGKGLYKNFEKNFCKVNNLSYTETTSVSNTQQLIGKMDKKKVKIDKKTEEIYFPVYGYFDRKSLIQDEVGPILNEVNDISKEIMRLVRLALDPYKNNEIEKKLTGDTAELRYYPKCNYLGLIHPTPLVNDFIKLGTFRRFSFIFELESDNEIDMNSLCSLDDECDDIEDYSSAIRGNYSLVKPNTLSYTKECKLLFTELYKLFLCYLLKNNNISLKKYGLTAKFGLKDLFAKHINILHIAHGKKETEPELLIHAFFDFFEIQLLNIKTLTKYVRYDLENAVWNGLNEKEILLLDYLYRKNATSEDSSCVTMKRFHNVIGSVYGILERQAKNISTSLKARNFIDSRQVGTNGSCVWLTAVPKEFQILNDVQDYDMIQKYIKGCKGCNDSDTHTKNIYMCQIYNIYNNNYNYNNNKCGQNIAPLAPLKKDDVVEYILKNHKHNGVGIEKLCHHFGVNEQIMHPILIMNSDDFVELQKGVWSVI